MALKFASKLLLAKIEATYGTDPTPTGAANAIQTANLAITPIEAETEELNLDDPNLGHELATHYGKHVVVEFDVPFASAGAAGTAPAWGPLMLACGCAETVNAGTSVEYDPVSSDEDSVTLYPEVNGQRHACTGARGSWSVRFQSGFPWLHFRFVGLWVDPATVTTPTPDWSAWQDPIVMSNANTTFSLHGESPKTYAITMDQANEVVYQNLVGQEDVQIVDRASVGTVSLQAPILSTKNWFTTVGNNTTGALQLVHGTAGGSIVQVDAPRVQLMNPRYAEVNGVAALNMDMRLLRDSGNDDWKITAK